MMPVADVCTVNPFLRENAIFNQPTHGRFGEGIIEHMLKSVKAGGDV